MKQKLLIFLGALIGALSLVGCGGGGAVGGPSAARVSTYATDSLNDDYSQVWVTIYQVVLQGGSGDQVVFDDPAGMLLDLKTLRDGRGARFAFLDDRAITPGTYEAIRVQLDEDLSLVPTGSTVAEARQFAVRHADATTPGKSVLVLPAAHNIHPGRNEVVLDFDLSNWDLDASGRVVAVIKRGDGNGLDDRGRHERHFFRGTVANLTGTAPNQTFNLTRDSRSLEVRTDANTRIFNESGADNPTLANGVRVKVLGTVVRGALLAVAIKIDDEQGEDPHEIKGLVSNLNESAGTFDIRVLRASGFLPRLAVYQVTTDASIVFLSDAGAAVSKAEFFAQLAAMGTRAMAEVEGTLNGNVFAATKAKIEDEGDVFDGAEVKGTVTAVDARAGTLTILATSWEGINLRQGASVQVVTVPVTVYRLDGALVDKATFFAAIAVRSRVEAKGRFDGTRLTAIRLKDED